MEHEKFAAERHPLAFQARGFLRNVLRRRRRGLAPARDYAHQAAELPNGGHTVPRDRPVSPEDFGVQQKGCHLRPERAPRFGKARKKVGHADNHARDGDGGRPARQPQRQLYFRRRHRPFPQAVRRMDGDERRRILLRGVRHPPGFPAGTFGVRRQGGFAARGRLARMGGGSGARAVARDFQERARHAHGHPSARLPLRARVGRGAGSGRAVGGEPRRFRHRARLAAGGARGRDSLLRD